MIGFLKYIWSVKTRVLFYYFSVAFIILIFKFGDVNSANKNVEYAVFVISVFYLLFLAYEYIRFRRSIKIIRDKIDMNSLIPNSLFSSFESEVYGSLINDFILRHNEYKHLREQLSKDYDDYVNSWVHEIKTPITVIKLELDSDDEVDNNLKNSLYEEIEKIESFVEQSLYYSKIDNFNKDYVIDEVLIDSLINKVLKNNFKMFMKKKIIINKESLKFSIISDKKWLEYILTQIVTNSIKYVDSGGKISIYYREDNENYYLVIEDNGCGIPPEEINSVYDRGFIGSKNRNSKNSTGMGLYLSQKLMERLGHNINIESVEDEYTKVSLIFKKYIDHYDL